MTCFEDLSDEIIISIIEYLPMEEFVSMFGKLNTRLACIIFDHPWTQHQLSVQLMDDKAVEKKLDFIDEMKLASRISSISIRPFSIHRTITSLNARKPIGNFDNLRSLSLSNITLEEADAIFSAEELAKLTQLVRLRLIFSFGMEEEDYTVRLKRLIGRILVHPPLRHCILHPAQSVDFTEVSSPSSLESLDISFCSFQSLYTLFEFTPHLRHLTATIATMSELNAEQTPTFPALTSFHLRLSLPAFDQLTSFLEKCNKLLELQIVTYSVIEPLSVTALWHKLITEHLPVLTKFKRKSNVALENVAEHLEAMHWPNGWTFTEKTSPQGPNYRQITVVNVRY